MSNDATSSNGATGTGSAEELAALRARIAELEARAALGDRILEGISAPMFVTDKDLLITWINDSALRVAGYRRDEVVGRMTCADLSRTPLCGTADCTIRSCMLTREARVGDTVLTTRDGRKIPIAASCSAIFDEHGRPLGGIEVIVDRSDAVRAAWEMENVLSSIGAPMYTTDENLVITSINGPALSVAGYRREEVVGKMTCAELARTPLCGTDRCTIKNCMRTRQTITAETELTTRDGRRVPIAAVCSGLFDEQGRPYGGMEVVVDQTEQKSTLAEIARLVDAARAGDLGRRADLGHSSGDYLALRRGINEMLDAIVAPIVEATSVISEMARGNLRVQVDGDYQGDHARLKESLNETLSSLNELVGQVSMAVDQITISSEQVSASSQTLSQGAAEQAGSIEEITSSMEQMTAQTRQNADHAEQASRLAVAARDKAEAGNNHMAAMVQAIGEINEASGNIARIIKVIDEIAFQTNLLALNAAVEAARAGRHGKGFAVVAEEVRNLAMRSAKAAKETTELIGGSIKKVERGTVIANETAGALGEIVTGVTKVTDLVGEIASASREQAQGIGQVNQGIGQVEQVTQRNSASSEESASAAEELSSQAQQLKSMIARFELRENRRLQDPLAGLDPILIEQIRQLILRGGPPAPVGRGNGAAAGKGAGAVPWGRSANRTGQAPLEIDLDDKDFGSF